ncbi:cytochrome b/b6 domain-containing protein [Pseudomonas sp. R2.Fl]|nr:cytochrome b/b6 domain-containing protein [Pseudomonas sp. R2.Fl]
MKAQTPGRYPLALRLLHWLLALLLLVQVMLGFAAEHWTPRAVSDALFPRHFKLGVLILCLMILRLGLRLRLPVPADDGDAPRWHRRIRSCVHALIYLLVLALPISGHVIWVWMGADRTLIGGLQLPPFFVPPHDNETGRALAWYVHVYGAWTLSALVGLHVAAAVLRQWQGKDSFIALRMGFGAMPQAKIRASMDSPRP